MTNTEKSSRILLAILGLIPIALTTRWGIGLTHDSISYIAGARSIVSGAGFGMPTFDGGVEPITHHAPFYSMLLALVGMLGVEVTLAARWTNSVLFAGNILLVCGLVSTLTGNAGSARWNPFPVITGWLLLTSAVMLEIHSMAWTEALFIFLSYLSVVLLTKYLQGENSQILILSAVLVSLAALTRYAGLVWIATGFIAILWMGSKPLIKRFVSAGLYGIIGVLPLLVWLLRNYFVAGTATNRELSIHPVGITHAQQILTTLSSLLFIPETASGWIKLVAVIVGGGFILWGYYSTKPKPIVFKVVVLYIALYFIFLVLSISLLDANTPLDNRILSPILVGLVIILSLPLSNVFKVIGKRNAITTAATIIIVLGLLLITVRSPGWVLHAYLNGLGFNSVTWRNSELIASVKNLPNAIPIYSNAPEGIYIHTKRPAMRLPSKYQSANQQVNPQYGQDLASMDSKLKAHNGVIVYFSDVQRATYPQPDELVQALQLHPIARASDGLILAP